MRCLFWVCGVIVAACTPPPTLAPDAGAAQKGCATRFTHRQQNSATSVFLVGEWDGFARSAHPMSDLAGNGTWSGTFEVPAGRWAYAFLENGAEVLDPTADGMRYVDGRPWAAIDVADCHLPSVQVQPGTRVSHAGTFSVDLITRHAEALDVELLGPDGTATRSRLIPAQGLATLAFGPLADGKYTARVTPTNADTAGPTLLLPFWVEAEPFSYADSPLYMLMIDRFRNGDPTNDVPDAADARFEGGDLQGVEAAIREGYFDALHVKALWLSPWQTQPSRVFEDGDHTVSGYHGYWPIRAREVEPRFGGPAALRSMVREAHQHGIRIVMDAVLNHVHVDHEYFKDPTKAGWFRTGCSCGSSSECGWDNAALTCLFRPYMPDVDWTHNGAADQFVDDVAWWLEEFDLDGVRVDAVKHVEDAAIINVAQRVRRRFETAGTEYYLFGETFSADVGTLKRYLGPTKLDGQLNFPLFMRMPETVFARDDQGLQQVRAATLASLSDFAGATMVDFIGNHDVARFITKADPQNRDRQGNGWENLPGPPVGQAPYDRLYLAFAHLMTTPSVPLVYYGDEYGEFGGADPDNRHFFRPPAAHSAVERDQLARMQALLAARARLRGLRRGPLLELWCNDEPWGSGRGTLMAYARPDPDPRHTAVVVLNLTASPWADVALSFPPQLQWQSGTLREALSGRAIPFSGSAVTLDVPARGAVVLSLQ